MWPKTRGVAHFRAGRHLPDQKFARKKNREKNPDDDDDKRKKRKNNKKKLKKGGGREKEERVKRVLSFVADTPHPPPTPRPSLIS